MILSDFDSDQDEEEYLFAETSHHDCVDATENAEEGDAVSVSKQQEDDADRSCPEHVAAKLSPSQPSTSGLSRHVAAVPISRLNLAAEDSESSELSEDDTRPPPTFRCVDCGQDCVHGQRLFQHRRQQHPEKNPYQCAYGQCGKTFTRPSHLARHVRTHTGEKPFSCSDCGASFARKFRLMQHFRTHTGEKPFSCSHCGASFSMKGALVRHIRTHTGEKPFCCKECNRSFTLKSHLVSHVRIHTGEKPYSCPVCHGCFSQRSNLNSHLKTHH